MTKINWSKYSDDDAGALAKEAMRATEALIDAQLKLANSSDQRAAVMASIYTAATAAIVGVLAKYVGDGAAPAGVIWGGIVIAACFFVAAVHCVYATLPVGFYVTGIEPDDWRDDIERGDALRVILASQIDEYQRRITENDSVLRRNSGWFKRGAKIGISAPLLGIIVWFLVSKCH